MVRRIGTGTSDIREDDIRRVNSVLRSGRLSAGPMIDSFERLFAEKHGAKYAAMCNSGTGALQLALQTLKERYGWPDGAEVIVPAMTFVATINVILFNRLRPVLVDIEPRLFTMDPVAFERAITPETVAVIPVHLYGQPADMTAIMEVARARNLKVIEDSCEAVGVTHRGQVVGSFGDFACFSTYMAHHVTTGVGGLALTNDEANATHFRSLMNHGRDPLYIRMDDDQGVSDEKLLDIIEARYRFLSVGQSFRATEMEAALGIGQIMRIDETIRQRRQKALWLESELEWLPLELPVTRMGDTHSYMMYPILAETPEYRDRLVVALERAGVETRPLMPIIDQPCYGYFRDFGMEEDYPITEDAMTRGFFIGCHQGMTRADIDYIGEVARAA